MASAEEKRIAELEARVAGLEEALVRRSREFRLLQRHLSKRDLVVLSRLAEGLTPLPLRASEPAFWRETTDFEATGVEEVLQDLWGSLYPNATPAELAKPGPGKA
jgi:hypothetical protein